MHYDAIRYFVFVSAQHATSEGDLVACGIFFPSLFPVSFRGEEWVALSNLCKQISRLDCLLARPPPFFFFFSLTFFVRLTQMPFASASDVIRLIFFQLVGYR